MRSTRVSNREVMKSTETKEASCTGKGKGTKKASKVAIVEGNNELELKHDVSKDISSPPKNQITAKLSSSETKEISTPTSSPKSAILKKFASVVTPGEEDKKSVGKTAKLATKKGLKGAFGRKTLIEDFGDDEIVIRKAPVEVSPLVDFVYSQVRESTGALGGNGATGAIYGELTMRSMQKIVNYMVECCDLTYKSRFIDIGAGLGKPNFHVAQDPCCRLSLGVELEDIRWQLSMKNLSDVAQKMSDDAGTECSDSNDTVRLHSGVNFISLDIDDAETLNPLTHIYQYDLGFPPPLQQRIAQKFNTSLYAQWFISYRPPHRVINEYGYEVEFMSQFLTSMHGSGEGHTVYFYRRLNPLCKPKANSLKVLIPARLGFEEEDEEVVCDKAFIDAVRLAVGPVKDLRKHAQSTVEAYVTSGRPKRDRKPRVFLDC